MAARCRKPLGAVHAGCRLLSFRAAAQHPRRLRYIYTPHHHVRRHGSVGPSKCTLQRAAANAVTATQALSPADPEARTQLIGVPCHAPLPTDAAHTQTDGAQLPVRHSSSRTR